METIHDEIDIKPLISPNLTIDTHFSSESCCPKKWSPGSWQDGSRKSAFLPYKQTLGTVLTNLQRGNTQAETPVPEETDITFHTRAGQGEITENDIKSEKFVDVTDSEGLTALHWAAAYGQIATVQLLNSFGAEIDKLGPEGETALLLAANGGHHDVVRFFLNEGANVNHVDDVGNTALMYAASGNHPHCCNELLLRGADVTMVNHCNDSAYKLAVDFKSNLGASVAAICQVLKWLWNTIFYQCIAIITLYSIWLPIKHNIDPLFSWHVIFCTIGVLPLLTISLILFAHHNVWSQSAEKDGKRSLQKVVCFISLIFIIAGVTIESLRKEKLNISHFVTQHAIMGLLSTIFIAFAFCGGSLTCLPLLFRGYVAPVWFQIAYKVIWQIGYLLGLICLILGYYTDFFKFYSSQKLNVAATILTAIIAAWSLLLMCKSTYEHVRRVRSYLQSVLIL